MVSEIKTQWGLNCAFNPNDFAVNPGLHMRVSFYRHLSHPRALSELLLGNFRWHMKPKPLQAYRDEQAKRSHQLNMFELHTANQPCENYATERPHCVHASLQTQDAKDLAYAALVAVSSTAENFRYHRWSHLFAPKKAMQNQGENTSTIDKWFW